MNKTVTINISGIIFHIEEDAYDSLNRYLAAIKGYFSKTDGGNEIMSDIEARIAELLQEKINVSKQVILMTDVDYVKNVMGKPEDFGGEPVREEEKVSGEQFEYSREKIKRRLFRNPDEKTIGGVCSGMAAYFDIDTVWVRLAMFLLIFFGGISLWVYIILWIVIPQAKTTADKLAMRGESANINNIFQSFKEEAEDVKTRFTKNGKEYSRHFYDASTKVRSGASALLYTLFNILGRLVGLFLLLVGGFLLFVYVMVLLGISIVDGNVDTSISDWKAAVLNSPSDYVLGVISFIIVVGIPVLMMVYAGIKLLFKVRYSNRWLNLGLGLTWLVGFIIGCYVTISTVKQFSQNSKVKEIKELHGMSDTIFVRMNPASSTLKAFNINGPNDLEMDRRHNGGYCFGEIGNKMSIIGFANLDVIESTSDSMELVIYQSAKGGNKKEANETAKGINYTYQQHGNVLLFDEIFYTEAGAKFRAQELDLKLKLPKGKVIYFDKSVKHLLDDVDNTTKTWDGDMIGRRWKMTEKGLECIDCQGLDTNTDEEADDDEGGIKTEHVTINDKGIQVNAKDAEIKIDEDGIKIKTPEKEYEIKSDKKEEREAKEKHKK